MKKFTAIELDKTRNLRYSLSALEYIEEQTGKSFMTRFAMTSMKDIAIVLYAGLRHEDPSLTIEAIGDMVDMDNLPYVAERIHTALGSSVPKNEEGESRPTTESQSN